MSFQYPNTPKGNIERYLDKHDPNWCNFNFKGKDAFSDYAVACWDYLDKNGM